MTNTTTLAIARHDRMGEREIAVEHAALARQWAALQHSVSEQMLVHARHVQSLEGEVLLLRAQLVVARTCLLWGLNTAGVMRPLTQRARWAEAASEAAAMAESSEVICQTGCVGHAHPWLEADGQCRRTGVACENVSTSPRITSA